MPSPGPRGDGPGASERRHPLPELDRALGREPVHERFDKFGDQLGLPRSDMALFKRWSDGSVAPLGGMLSLERGVECARSIVDFPHDTAARIEERRAAPLNVAEMPSILQTTCAG